MSETRVYMDYSATAPLREPVLEAMLPYLCDAFGNAGSLHREGRRCRKAVDDARERAAALLNADPRDIVFTSGGTEADNLAVRGAVEAVPAGHRRVLVSAVEHAAVLSAADHARDHAGADVHVVPVDRDGLVDPEAVDAHLADGAALVSVMHVNNETGAVQPIAEVAARCAARGAPFHTDAIQAAGLVPLDVRATPCAFVSLSAHKLGGPKGVGALWMSGQARLVAQAVGGSQERGRRAGTENVAGIVGFGMACELALAERPREVPRVLALRTRLEDGILAAIPSTEVNGPRSGRAPHILNVAFHGADAESLLLSLDLEGVAVSTGAACTAGSVDPSHVLLAMGRSQVGARSALRFSLGWGTTDDDVDRLLELLPPLVARVRHALPL